MSRLAAHRPARARRRGGAGPRTAPGAVAGRLRGGRGRRRHRRARRLRDSEHAAELLAELPGATVEQVAEGWEDAWRDFHRPVVAGGLWLGPPWETPPDPASAVVIDPGRAFGTGCASDDAPLRRAPRHRGHAWLAPRRRLRLGGPRDRRGRGSGSRRCSPSTSIPSRSRPRARTRASNGVAVETAVARRARRTPLPSADVAVANVLLASGRDDPRAPRRAGGDHVRLPRRRTARARTAGRTSRPSSSTAGRPIASDASGPRLRPSAVKREPR